MRPLLIASAITLMAGAARAHGTIPTSNSICFGPGGGALFLGTNFGGVVRRAGDAERFVCETLVTGEPQSIDLWSWLPSGAILAAVTQGGLIRGVFASDPSACVYGVVAGTEDYLISDLVADPDDPGGFLATGNSESGAALLRGSPDGAMIVVGRAGEALGVRAAGGKVVSTFLVDDAIEVVYGDGAKTDTWIHPVAAGERIRPLGVDPDDPGRVWLVKSGEAAEVVLFSDDRGETMTPVLTLDSRIGGFAARGGTVWLQGPRAGVYRSIGGGPFEELVGTPHGSCLAHDDAGKLYACGVPWQDGFALGVSEDGARFTPVIPYYDGIVGALACPDAPEATTTCDGELEFLREYYGFSDPSTIEPGPEVAEGVETVEAVEADGGDGGDGVDAAEVVESVAEPKPRRDESCGGGWTGGPWCALAGASLWLAHRRSRRCVGDRGLERDGSVG